MKKRDLTATNCLIALALSTLSSRALAQEAASPAPASAAADDDQTIVVTAQRREERLIDVPISVTALSAETLKIAGVTDTADLDIVTPGLRMDQTGGFVQPAIRGVSTVISGSGDANVATYVDGVFQPTMLQALFSLRDVSSVEVLKGPQGTLFGRNSTGGAILVNTLQPDLDESTGEIAFGYSSFRTIEGSEFVSIPVVSRKVALSVSSSAKYMDKGYINDFLHRDSVGKYSSALVRGKLRFIPWEGADFTITGVYTDIADGLIYTRTNYQGHSSRAAVSAAAGLPLADEPYEYSGDVVPLSKLKYWSTSLRGTIDIGPGKLTTTTAYVDNKQLNRLDTDNTLLPLIATTTLLKTTAFTHETFYATNQLGRVRAIGGFFYINKDADNASNTNNFASVNYVVEKIKSWALFGELTFDLTNRISIVAGARYSSEKYTGGRALTAGGIQVRPPVPVFASNTWRSLDPRLSIKYELSDNSNIYFTYSQGFKSGFFNVAALQAQPVNPEKIKAYEIGYKGVLAPGILLSAAGFYYDYKDLQQLIRTTDPVSGATLNIIQNAAAARIKGAEVSGSVRVTHEFRLAFGATYLDAKFRSFPGALVTQWIPPSTIRQVPIDASGNTMIRSPKFSGNITASYDKKTPAGTFSASATLFATSKIYHEAGNRVVEGAYTKLNASLSWQPLGDTGLKVTVYGKNLTNSATIMATTFSTSYDAFSYEPPRSYGVELSYKF